MKRGGPLRRKTPMERKRLRILALSIANALSWTAIALLAVVRRDTLTAAVAGLIVGAELMLIALRPR